MMNVNTDQTENKYLFSLVIPIAFQQFMTAMVSVTDTLMLGNLTQNMLSGASLAGQLTFVYSIFMTILSIGLGTLISQYYGRGDTDAVEKLFGLVMSVSVVGSAVFFSVALFTPTYWMRLFTDDKEIIVNGAGYLRAVAPMYLLSGVSGVYQCILRCCGRAKEGSLISVAGVVINIIGNALLIFGLFWFPRLEIRGAAYATDIARIIELALSMVALRGCEISLKHEWLFHSIGELGRDFIRLTLPVVGNELAWGIGVTVYSMIMGHLGADSAAANAVITTVRYLTICLCVGIGSGGSVIIGNELGAGHLERARKFGDKLCGLSIIFGIAAGLTNLLAIPLVGLFIPLNAQAYEYLKLMLVFSILGTIGKSVNSTTIGGIFCAGGDTRFGLICDLITIWGVILPLSACAAFILQLPVPIIYGIISLDEVVKLPAVYIHYKKYGWVKDLTRVNEEKTQRRTFHNDRKGTLRDYRERGHMV